MVEVAPEVPWSTYLYWKRSYQSRGGESWERMLDGRLPPRPRPIPEPVRLAACLLRRANRSINVESARQILKE